MAQAAAGTEMKRFGKLQILSQSKCTIRRKLVRFRISIQVSSVCLGDPASEYTGVESGKFHIANLRFSSPLQIGA
jgi:hypothetical protein